MDDISLPKGGPTNEEKTAFLFCCPAIVGWIMTITVFVFIISCGPFWLNLHHTHKIGLLTSPGRFPSDTPFEMDCLTLMFSGPVGSITSLLGIFYVSKRPSQIRRGIRWFCHIVNLSWLAYLLFTVSTFDIGAIQ